MKRTLLAFLLLAAALPVAAINTRLGPGDRVCVLQVRQRGDFDDRLAQAIRDRLENALRQRGFHTVESNATLDDVRSNPHLAADYFVEIVSADSDAYPTGGVAVGAGHVGIDVSVIVSRVAAELRIYDGRTLELLETRPLHRQNVTVAPSGVGIGSYHASIWVALPFVEWARYRSAVRAVVEQAAATVSDVSGMHR